MTVFEIRMFQNLEDANICGCQTYTVIISMIYYFHQENKYFFQQMTEILILRGELQLCFIQIC